MQCTYQLERSRSKFKRFAAKYEREIEQVTGQFRKDPSAIEKLKSSRAALMHLRSFLLTHDQAGRDTLSLRIRLPRVNQEDKLMMLAGSNMIKPNLRDAAIRSLKLKCRQKR
ncbi:hypothetical protein PsorP6_007726 [Peronosclerospora sorghi]|uniref:Uncharacterized protein n=1 Tax=Peronosclerospora sorghi TaxID=230839 RepID=A0ACC0W915_9STRA|nr:hypothetical protein PsorP6_007726 [Peronosclerospora sorghi]